MCKRYWIVKKQARIKTKLFQQKHKIYRYLWITSVTKHIQIKEKRNINVMTFI